MGEENSISWNLNIFGGLDFFEFGLKSSISLNMRVSFSKYKQSFFWENIRTFQCRFFFKLWLKYYYCLLWNFTIHCHIDKRWPHAKQFSYDQACTEFQLFLKTPLDLTIYVWMLLTPSDKTENIGPCFKFRKVVKIPVNVNFRPFTLFKIKLFLRLTERLHLIKNHQLQLPLKYYYFMLDWNEISGFSRFSLWRK